MGKSAIVSSRGRRLGPPPGAVPPSRQTSSPKENTERRSRGRSNDTISWKEEKSRKSISRRNSVKWKDIKKEKSSEKIRKASIDLDEAGDGVIVSEIEANKMIASLRSRSSSETSSYSSRTASSTDTSLCDENEKASDSEPELPDDDKVKSSLVLEDSKMSISPILNDIDRVSPLVKDSIISFSTESDSNIIAENTVKNISDYLDSAAGEPLRTYIDGFETKLKESVIISSDSDNYKPLSPFSKPISPFKSISPYTPQLSSDRSEILQRLSSKKYEEKTSSDDLSRPKNLCKPPSNLTDLSPIDLSCKCNLDIVSPYNFDFQSNFNPTSQPITTTSRPPDIIDSIVMYPNFVPDIDLSDKNVSDFESPPRSPGTESIIVSEDEPPIPLKIDKYFEHSPEFFGARVTDPNNTDIPNRRAVKRHSRLPKKPDSLTLQTNHNEKIMKIEAERASSLPQSHSFTSKKSPSLEIITTPIKTNVLLLKQEDFTQSTVLQLKQEEFTQSNVLNLKQEDFMQSDVLNLKQKDFAHSNLLNLKQEDFVQSDLLNLKPENVAQSEVLDLKQEDMMQSNELDLKQEERSPKAETPVKPKVQKLETPTKPKTDHEMFSPKDYILRSGRKNSERALQIIQENSKILSRILTKQNIPNAEMSQEDENVEKLFKPTKTYSNIPENAVENKPLESPLLKESTSDSLIGYRKRNVSNENCDKNDFIRVRPISIDDPSSLDVRNTISNNPEFNLKNIKSPSNECLGNKTDLYGWENKGFLAKCEYKSFLDKTDTDNVDFKYKRNTCDLSDLDELTGNDLKPVPTSLWARHSFSEESKTSVTLPSTEPKDNSTYDKRYTSEDYNYPFSSRYNDFVLSKASDICSKTVDQGPKACEKLSKTDNSQVSDFAHVVTSSISFTYEPSAEDDSPTGVKSNSSDTLCQITSLDQVSTPISPKIFPRETPTFPKEYIEKSDKTVVESDDTCSAITSLIETDTLSSLSYPRSPSTGSYHPFPNRPAMRMPKELGVRLGMYPKDTINSSPK